MSLERIQTENVEHGESRPLYGKSALVTGSGRDIGAAISIELARKGVNVIGHYRRKLENITEVSKKCHEAGGTMQLVCADLASESERDRMFEAIPKLTKGSGLDFLVLNASGTDKVLGDGLAHQMNAEIPNKMITQYLPIMNEGGKIIYLQSVPGFLSSRYNDRLLPDVYKSVAPSKKEGENSLRERKDEFIEKGVTLAIVCPPEVNDTFNIRYFGRKAPDFPQHHRYLVDTLSAYYQTPIPYEVSTVDVGMKVAEIAERKDIPTIYTELFEPSQT